MLVSVPWKCVPWRALRGRLLLLVLGLCLSACALVGGYSARAHEQLTGLKAAHLKLIDDQTEGPRERAWQADRLDQAASALDLRFREAIEFANSLDDPLRRANLGLLRQVLAADLTYLRERPRWLREPEAQLLREGTSLAYERAIRGECAREGSACRAR